MKGFFVILQEEIFINPLRMKVIYFLIFIFSIAIVQSLEHGKYFYSQSHFSESLELNENQKFKYNVSVHFAQYEVEGTYHIINDSLVLNSYPQRDRIIVHEASKGKFDNIVFDIKRKFDNAVFAYHLHIILTDTQELVLKDQWDKSKLKNTTIKGFYIVDTNGLRSPTYMLQGTHTNNFKVLFETRRVFENEKWGIKDDKIIPRGFGGELQNYFLEKRK